LQTVCEMTDLAICIEGLGKQYRLGEKEPYKTARDLLASLPSRLFGRGNNASHASLIWALKDISVEVRAGEVVGIIGRNGSGKSTLLKVLSRITDPTTGRAVVNGRVGALLEVGTGFHPELTGRENIFVNGAILGMPRSEIQRKFDAIVEFSGVEEFLDTPVKRYSSGMRVRLAFSVAAHLEPEILFVDEVLAVGDAAFQRKCLGRMNDVANEGRTIIFVSHQMEAIMGLCQRAIWLDKGQIRFDGSADDAVQTYISHQQLAGDQRLDNRADRKGSGALRVTEITLNNALGLVVQQAMVGERLTIRMPYHCDGQEAIGVEVRIWIENLYGQRLCSFATQLTGQQFLSLPAAGELVCDIPRLALAPGLYNLTYVIEAGGKTLDKLYNAMTLEVVAADFFGRGQSLDHVGAFLIDHDWSVN
jgi:lipopolysaccharide transport system ATP-binding protein